MARGASTTETTALLPGTSSLVAETTSEARTSRAAANTVTDSTVWLTVTANSVTDNEAADDARGGKNGGVRTYVSLSVLTTSRFATRPVTSSDTLRTSMRPSSVSVAGYARVTSRRYTFLCAS